MFEIKKLAAFLLVLIFVLSLAGCNTKSMNYIIENRPSVTGIVEEVHDDHVVIYSDTADGYPNGSRWRISLNVENKDSYTDFVIGDEIVAYHDGNVMETEPLKVGKIYAITLRTPADRAVNEDETEETEAQVETSDQEQEISPPGREEVLAARKAATEGMTEEEIARLTENIKVANNQMEQAYFYQDLFGRLEDPQDLYWNYFDQKGDIQIDWAYDGSIAEQREICKKENLTTEAFYEKYGTPVMTYNRFHGENFIALLEDMKGSVTNDALITDLERLMEETRLAVETHDVIHANNIFQILHDMDYFLLRYGIEDVGKYTQDASFAAKYYGALSIYE